MRWTLPGGDRSPRAFIDAYEGTSGSGSTVERFLGRDPQTLQPGPGGAFLLEARAGGTVTLALELRRRIDGELRRWSVAVQPDTLDLDAWAEEQVVPLRADARNLETALEEIGRR